MKHIISLLLFVTILFSCTSNTEIVINGQFYGKPNRIITIEYICPLGHDVVDTISTDTEGSFSFTISELSHNPSFYNIHMGENFVPLLLEQGETVELSAVGNIHHNYLVQGSKGSELIKEFNLLVRNYTLKLDSIRYLYNHSINLSVKKKLNQQYAKTYINLKQATITFITKNNKSLASLIPIYQPYNGTDKYIFDAPEDFIYFKMLSDSLQTKYPNSQYVISMKKDVDYVLNNANNRAKMDSLIDAGFKSPLPFPDIVMRNARGEITKLSSMLGNVIFLHFTASNTRLKLFNQELMLLYKESNTDGFDVFQVYADNSKSLWLNTISSQRIPWTTVCDALGRNSPVLSIYNIQMIPSSFLIDREGDIVGHNLTIDELRTELQNIL